MRLSIVTVTYNCEDFIETFIKKLLVNIPEDSEVVLVDNNSSDKTIELVRKFKEVKFISSEKNLGFGKGCNLGAKSAKGDYLFFLNPDTLVKEKIFAELIKFIENDESIGLLAPKLVYPNGESQASVKKLPTVFGAILEFIFGIKEAYSQFSPSSKEPIEVEAVYGAAVLIKKSLFDKLGGFNGKYFMYYEDIDLCRRIRTIGKKVFYYPGVSIVHILGASKTDQDRYSLNLESAKIYHGFLRAYFLQMIFWVPRVKRKIGF